MAKIDVLVVGGGGGGGNTTSINYSGGGGAGGLIYQTDFDITAGSYTVTVGAGGWTGGNSVFSTLTAVGGGSGGATANGAGSAGGSGGGGCPNNGAGGGATSSQGYAGGWGSTTTGSDSGAGGGGGSAAAGQDVGSGTGRNAPGLGGAGTACSITGTSLYYAAGGNGPGYYSGARPSGIGGGNSGQKLGEPATFVSVDNVPTANTGSGGAGRTYLGGGIPATIGADGVVIIRYKTSSFGTCTGGTITTDGDYTVHKFTSSGTFVCKLKSSGFFNFF